MWTVHVFVIWSCFSRGFARVKLFQAPTLVFFFFFFFFFFYSYVAGVVSCGGRKKILSVHHYVAGYILSSLGSLSPSWLILKSNTA